MQSINELKVIYFELLYKGHEMDSKTFKRKCFKYVQEYKHLEHISRETGEPLGQYHEEILNIKRNIANAK